MQAAPYHDHSVAR